MELTLEEALQKAVEAHKAGQIQEADRLYTAILQAQPKHADANHNMGVLVVSVGKVQEALPFFKTALEANSSIGQYWLSYIDALIKLDRIVDAKAVLAEVKDKGAKGEAFEQLEQRLNLPNELPTDPPQEQLNSLLEHYQNGRFNDAEKLAVFTTQDFPKHQFAWQVLGAVLRTKGRKSEAVDANQTAVALSPQDAAAHSNLGNTLQELGRLDEAEASYTRAIALKPNFAQAHYNLGNTLQELGRLDEAEESYTQAIALNPDLAEAHYNLGATLKELGRFDEAAASYTQAIVLKPDYAKAHSNLGITLKELGRLDDAEASYAQAIALKPDYAEAHSNLGNTLKELGRLDEAEASYTQAIALKPDYAEAHSNLGNTLKELGKLEKAEASYTQAIALKPDFAEAHYNLGITLLELGRLDEAEASLRQAIALKPDYPEALNNLSIVQSYMNNLAAEIISLQNLLQIDSDDYGLRAGVNLAVCNFLEGDFTESKKHLLAATKIQEKTSSESKNERIYWRYLSGILKWHENKYLATKKEKHDKNLYVLGESHSLTSHHLRIQNSEVDFFCSARLIKGCKQWHLGNAFKNKYKHQFESIFCALPKNSYVLLAFGEIDCRLETGIIAHKNKFSEKQLKEIILTTIESYLTYIVNINFGCQHKVIIQGVPCPNIDVRNHSEKDIEQLVEVIKIFNYELKNKSKRKGFEFLDVYKLTDRGDGLSNSFWHIDSFHLSPDGIQEAWRRYASE